MNTSHKRFLDKCVKIGVVLLVVGIALDRLFGYGESKKSLDYLTLNKESRKIEYAEKNGQDFNGPLKGFFNCGHGFLSIDRFSSSYTPEGNRHVLNVSREGCEKTGQLRYLDGKSGIIFEN